MTHWAEKYSGLRFVDGGRDRAGVDCWGLVKMIYENEKSISLPAYGDVPASELMKVARQIVKDRDASPWKIVIDPEPFDVVLMRGGINTSRQTPVHVGVMIDGERVMHVEQGISVMVVPLSHQTISRRVIGLRRHEALA
jgi:cell wall-associated NlpC family hydrolase